MRAPVLALRARRAVFGEPQAAIFGKQRLDGVRALDARAMRAVTGMTRSCPGEGI